MSLQPQLQVISLSEDKASIVVKDVTPAYDATLSPGGYGAPNPTYGQGFITITYLEDASYYTVLNPADTAALRTGVTITAAALGVPGGVFKDGVFDINYYVGVAVANIGVTPGSKVFTLASANTALVGSAGIILSAGGPPVIQFYDTTVSFTGAGGSFLNPIDSSFNASPYNGWILYAFNFKLLVKETGRLKLINDISLWNFASCPEKDPYEILKRYKYKLAMEIQFAKGHYLDAHLAALYLQG